MGGGLHVSHCPPPLVTANDFFNAYLNFRNVTLQSKIQSSEGNLINLSAGVEGNIILLSEEDILYFYSFNSIIILKHLKHYVMELILIL